MKNIYFVFHIFVFFVYNVICDIFIPVQIVDHAHTPPYVPTSQMDSIVYKTVNKYYCSVKDIQSAGHNLILYGTKGWTFPVQDVNLTLRYPSNNENNELQSQYEQYVITGFEVILSMDGNGSNGYITDGGIMEESLTLTFTSSRISTIKYQFWVYGFRKDINMNSLTWSSDYSTMCK